MNRSAPLYSEVQSYRELPPFTLLTVVGALFGWFLIIWVVALGRPLGALTVPTWLALTLGLLLGLALPLIYWRMRMLTEVYADRVLVSNGMSGGAVFRLADVTGVEVRTDDIREDYNVRNVATIHQSNIAYTVSSHNGVQLSLGDGRLFLIGSKQPEALGAAVQSAWRAARPELAEVGAA